MKIVLRVALLAIVAALGYWLWTVFFPGPEKLIQGKVTSLATTVTFNAGDSPLIRAGGIVRGNPVGHLPHQFLLRRAVAYKLQLHR